MPTTLLDDVLDAARQSQLYSYLHHPKHALTLTCLDACKLQLLSSGGGLRLFRHRRRPTVFVHLVGRVIGIEEKEKKVVWLVDDGSAVIAVHHLFKYHINTPMSKVKLRLSRKGKERQMDDVIGGIPSEYLLPPPPPLPPSKEESEKRKGNPKTPINVADAFEIGCLVSIVGRVELWVDRRERILFVDNVIRSMKEFKFDGTEHEGWIQLVIDCNEEPRHMLRALHLSATEYSQPYHPPTLIAKETAPMKLREIVSPSSRSTEAQHSIKLRDNQSSRVGVNEVYGKSRDTSSRGQSLRIMDKSWRSLRVMEDVSDVTNNGAARKRTLGVSRHPLPEKSSKRVIIAEKNAEHKEEDRSIESLREKEMIDLPSSLLSVTSNSNSNTATPRQRQLRHYTKLSDSKMTDSTFRVYVEKYIVDYCSGDADATPKASNRRGDQKAKAGPPAFTLNDLMQVDELRGHANRTVEVLTKRREEKKRRKAESASTSAAKVVVSTEKACDKMKRLYASVIQAMLMDGIIVFALPRDIEGKRQCHDKGRNQPCNMEQEYRRAPIQEEDAYQVVTPALLLDVITDILSRSNINTRKSLNSVQIVQKMQVTDERWRFIRLESVQESMQLLLPHHQDGLTCTI